MALFRRGNKDRSPKGASQKVPTAPQRAYCRICRDVQPFSACWLRRSRLAACEHCGVDFANGPDPYKRVQPACPQCDEPVEQPGFEYGACDGCGSKYELVPGTPPNLLPNKHQRDQMNAVGRSRSVME